MMATLHLLIRTLEVRFVLFLLIFCSLFEIERMVLVGFRVLNFAILN